MIAIGQGPVTATPIQMARVMAFVANGERLPVPRLAVAVGPHARPAESESVAVPAAALARVRQGMRAAVVTRGGTGQPAFSEAGLPPSAEVYGKTGTAEVGWREFDADPARKGPWHHWFVGYARGPSAKRDIAFAMVLHAREEAGAGGTAARGVARFLRWWFGRAP
jgi:penicillin-binding protein 2